MQRESYKARSGAMRYHPVIEESELRHLLFSETPGFCIACGLDTTGVEPDARRYRCDECGDMAVYGLEELLLMGLVRIGEVTR